MEDRKWAVCDTVSTVNDIVRKAEIETGEISRLNRLLTIETVGALVKT